MPNWFALCFIAVCLGYGANAIGASFDHMLPRNDNGLFSRQHQLALEWSSAAALTGLVILGDSQTAFGRTASTAFDAMASSALLTQAAKITLRRQRPRDGNDPDAWFSGSNNRSFPSGEVAHITAIVTPFIATYQQEYPAVWLLSALPVYDGLARMKSQAHWQTDVLTGAAIGLGIGLYCHQGACPLSMSPWLNGVGITWRGHF